MNQDWYIATGILYWIAVLSVSCVMRSRQHRSSLSSCPSRLILYPSSAWRILLVVVLVSLFIVLW